MSRLGMIGALLLSGIVGFAVYCFTPQPAVPKPPLTYSNPIAVTPQQVRVGGTITSHNTRCNNTDHALEVEATVFWQSKDARTLIPYTTLDGKQVGKVQAVISEGCREQVGGLTLPPEITPNTWRLVGSVCWGGVTIIGPQTCTQWGTSYFEVTP